MLRGIVLTCLAVTVMTKEEETKESPESVAIAATLIGAITFQMMLFYLLNNSDVDIRKYSYEAVSMIISIFCAVLLFQSFNDVVEAWLFVDKTKRFECIVDGLHMLFWYVALQFSLALCSGAISEWIDPWETRNMEIDEIESSLKCHSVLLAHITGFASINFWSGIQHLPFFSSSPAMSFLTLPISACLQFGLNWMWSKVRTRVALCDDDQWDEKEQLWEEETTECEVDIMGLTVSFQAVQVTRFAISGILPNQEGEEPWDKLLSHTGNESGLFLFVAFLFALAVSVAIVRLKEDLESRVVRITITTLSMSFAWHTFFSFRWYIASWNLVGDDKMLLSVILAMVLFVLSFSVIWILDMILDSKTGGEEVEQAAKQIISAISFLIGFAWEQCFDKATLSLASVLPYRHLAKLVLALFCAFILVPAWRWWILPMVVKEGWKFGYVLDPKSDHWMELIQHDDFDSILEHLKRRHTELKEEEGYDVTRRLSRKIRTLTSMRKSTRESMSVGDRSSIANRPSLANAEEPTFDRQSSEEESEIERRRSSKLRLQNLHRRQTLTEFYNHLAGDEEEAQRQLKEVTQNNTKLEDMLKQAIDSYHAHMDTVQTGLGRIHQHVGAHGGNYSP